MTTNKGQKKCEICDFENAVRVGRAQYRCPKCGHDCSVGVFYFHEATGKFNIPTPPSQGEKECVCIPSRPQVGMYCPKHNPGKSTPSPIDAWEKEFDELFVEYRSDYKGHMTGGFSDDVRSFFRKTLSQAEATAYAKGQIDTTVERIGYKEKAYEKGKEEGRKEVLDVAKKAVHRIGEPSGFDENSSLNKGMRDGLLYLISEFEITKQ